MDAAKNFLFVPIPAKAKKLGLLSIYQFSLVTNFSSFIEIKLSNAKALQWQSLQKPQKMSADAPLTMWWITISDLNGQNHIVYLYNSFCRRALFTSCITRYFWQCGFYIKELWIFLNVALNTQWGLEFLSKQGTIVQGHFWGWHGGIWDCIENPCILHVLLRVGGRRLHVLV